MRNSLNLLRDSRKVTHDRFCRRDQTANFSNTFTGNSFIGNLKKSPLFNPWNISASNATTAIRQGPNEITTLEFNSKAMELESELIGHDGNFDKN